MALKTQGHWVSKKEPKIPVNGKPKKKHEPKKAPETQAQAGYLESAFLTVDVNSLNLVTNAYLAPTAPIVQQSPSYTVTPPLAVKVTEAGMLSLNEIKKKFYAFEGSSLSFGIGTSLTAGSQNPIVASLEKYIPGLSKMRVETGCPATSSHSMSCIYPSLVDRIIALNDQHKWTREQIADWLDTLDLDLSFKFDTAEEVNDEQPADQS